MANNPLHTVLDHLRRLQHIAGASPRSDSELLNAFAINNDQDAFAAVVTRHAPLVWGVCRRILRHHQDAEDAFQATFLVLARRAASIRSQTSIGGWLHTVAQRLAVRLCKQVEKRRCHEQQANRATPEDSPLRELASLVDEELQRLPAKYREPLLLHYLEGVTAETAARQLGMSRRTFYNRLAYGRELLRERLRRQGLSLTAPLLAAALTPETQAVSRLLTQSTIRVALGGAPQRVAALAAEAVGTTAMTKLKIGLALGLLLCVAAGGVEMLSSPAAIDPVPQAKERPAEPSKAKDKSAVCVDRHGDPLPPGAIARLGTLRFRVDAEIMGLAFAPDGKTIAVRGNGGVWLLDAVSGKQLRRVDRTGSLIPGIAFSPDGKQFSAPCHVGEEDRSGQVVKFRQVVRVWETASGRKVMESEMDNVRWMGWSADGQALAAYLAKGEMRLRELATGRERRFPAKELPKPVQAVLCSCVVAANVFAVSDEKRIVHICDLVNSKERCLVKAGGQYVRSMAFTPDGRLLASLAQDATGAYSLHLWDTSTGVAVHRIASKQRYIGEVVFSPDGQTLATIGWDDIHLWDAKTGRECGRIQTEGKTVQSAAFSHDGKTLATAERYSGTIHLWDLASARIKPEREGHTNRPGRPSFSPDGKRVATSGWNDGNVFIWNAATGEPLTCLQRGHLRGCVFLADGRTLCSCGEGNKLYWHDAISGRELHTVTVEDPDRPKMQQSGLSLYMSDDRTRLIVLSSNKNWEMLVTGWDVAARRQSFHRRGVRDSFYVFSPDARTLAALHPAMDDRRREEAGAKGSLKQAMRLEDAATGEPLLTFPRLKGQTLPLAFSPDGRLLISNTNGPLPQTPSKWGRILRMWEVLTAREVLALPFPDNSGFIRAAFSPNGRVLALSAPATEILLWDVRRGKELRRFKGLDAHVASLAFSPDGRRLVSGLSDSTLLVWDVAAPPVASAEKIGADGAAKAWADLAADDAQSAFRARGILASAPEEALPLLVKHLHAVHAADPQYLRRLLADLDSEQFTAREKAQNELEKLGYLAEPALRQTLANKPSLEMRRRVQAILERLHGPVKQPELLQALRAVAVLEDIGTPEARRLLQELTKGAGESRLTREAKESLRRLNVRSTSPSRDR